MTGDGEPLLGAQGTDALGTADPDRATRWRRALVWLLRLLSVVWLAKGLLAWTVILGVGGEAEIPFESRLLSFQAITVYFAVIDLVAAVGLWLTSSWGGVLWLLTLISQLLLGFFFPRLLPVTPLLTATYVGMMLVYFAATWAAENESS